MCFLKVYAVLGKSRAYGGYLIRERRKLPFPACLRPNFKLIELSNEVATPVDLRIFSKILGQTDAPRLVYVTLLGVTDEHSFESCDVFIKLVEGGDFLNLL